MLPFLKNKKEGAMSGPIESIEREHDEGHEPFEALDAVVDDMLEAMHSKNKSLLKSALEALCEYIQDKDEEQDEQLTNKE
jgi:hypothetical protein